MIKSYLSDLINNDKTPGLVRYHSGDKSWQEETSSEWKIQLTMAINFISSKDSDETRTIHTNGNNVEIMMVVKQKKLSRNFLNLFCKNIKKG